MAIAHPVTYSVDVRYHVRQGGKGGGEEGEKGGGGQKGDLS